MEKYQEELEHPHEKEERVIMYLHYQFLIIAIEMSNRKNFPKVNIEKKLESNLLGNPFQNWSRRLFFYGMPFN